MKIESDRLPNYLGMAPDSVKAMMALEASFPSGGLDGRLMELVKLRSSQINGCAFCIHLHVTEARKAGETDMRLHMLNAWRESSLYDERERAALAWTEALTQISVSHAPDTVYAELKARFTDKEQVYLTLLIGAVNVWNRLQIGFRARHPA